MASAGDAKIDHSDGFVERLNVFAARLRSLQ